VVDSPWIVEVSMDNFQEAVVAASYDRPVVIDFWAPWCAPCRALAPLLEKLAVEKDGGFLLAKVNTDENQELAQAFHIEGIPAVFAIRNGQVADHFAGLLPEEKLREFIDGLGSATPAEPTPLALAQKLETSDPKAAAEAYRGILATSPDETAARVGLARALLATPGKEAEVAPLLAGIEAGDFADEAKRLNTILQFREVPHTDNDLTSAKNATTAEGKLAQAKVLAARGDYTGAMDTLLAVADDDRALGRTVVRELMLKIFDVIGPRSPDADEYRRKLQNLLY